MNRLLVLSCVALTACSPSPTPVEPQPSSAGDEASANHAAPAPEEARVWFAVTVETGVDGTDGPRAFVVLDETRGAGNAGSGELVEVGNDAAVRALTRGVDAGQLDATLRERAASRWVGLGNERCQGTLGDIVELVLDGSYEDDEVHTVVLAAPLEGCSETIFGAHPEGAAPAQVFVRTDDDVSEAHRRDALAAVTATPWYMAQQAAHAAEYAPDEAGPWHDDWDVEYTALRAGDGRTIVQLWLGGRDRPTYPLVEHTPGGAVLHGRDPGMLVMDVAGDGTIESIDREGMLRDGERVRTFVRGPFIPGC